ncbi:MAG: hypothetical protein ACQEP3_02580 [Patescibacteria group bacterium]
MFKLFFKKLWKKGIRPTAFLIVAAIVFIIIVNFTQPFGRILAIFIPKEYIFWGLPFLVIMTLVVPIMGLITNGRVGNFISKSVAGIPLLNMIFKEEAKMELVKRGMPAAIELKIANVELYIYGFVTGTSKVINGSETEKTLVSIYLPSIPVPVTSWVVLDVNIKNVKEIEIVDGNINPKASIIQNKCISFGQPLGGKINLKSLEKKEVENRLEEEKSKSAEN